MNAPTSIYVHTRPVWELRLLRAVEQALTRFARSNPDPVDSLHGAYAAIEAADWEPALALTLPLVPEQFRHLWTLDRARDLTEGAFMIAMMKMDRQPRGRYMRKVSIPALEQAGCTVECVEWRP